MRPRYSTMGCSKVHFSALREMVLMEDVEDSYYDLMMLFIIVWKVVGLFIKPTNITRGSKRALFIQKVAFHSSPSLIHA